MIDEERVAMVSLGTARSNEDIETERLVYRRFQESQWHPKSQYILSCLEPDNLRGLVFKRCEESVRSRQRSSTQVPFETVVK